MSTLASFFTGPKIPEPPKPVHRASDAEIAANAARMRRKQEGRARGFTSTLLTGGRGTGVQATAGKALFGA